MNYEFKLKRRVEFSETDMAGIMHFSNFFRFMEAAEHAFFRSIGLSVVLSRCGLGLHLPRVHAECDYLAPVRFEDEILIHLLVQKKGTRSLRYRFRFYRDGEPQRQEVARGSLVVVCARVGPNGALKAAPIPNMVADKLREAPAHLLAESRPAPGSSNRTAAAQLRNDSGPVQPARMTGPGGAPRRPSLRPSARKSHLRKSNQTVY